MLPVYSTEERLTQCGLGPALPQEWFINGWAQAALVRGPRRKGKDFPQFLPTIDLRILGPQQSFLDFPSLEREDSLEGLLSHQRNDSISGNKGLVKSKRSVSWARDDWTREQHPVFSFCVKTKVTHQGFRVHLRSQILFSRVSVCPAGVTVVFPEGMVIFSGASAFLLGGMIFSPV